MHSDSEILSSHDSLEPDLTVMKTDDQQKQRPRGDQRQ